MDENLQKDIHKVDLKTKSKENNKHISDDLSQLNKNEPIDSNFNFKNLKIFKKFQWF